MIQDKGRRENGRFQGFGKLLQPTSPSPWVGIYSPPSEFPLRPFGIFRQRVAAPLPCRQGRGAPCWSVHAHEAMLTMTAASSTLSSWIRSGLTSITGRFVA